MGWAVASRNLSQGLEPPNLCLKIPVLLMNNSPYTENPKQDLLGGCHNKGYNIRV